MIKWYDIEQDILKYDMTFNFIFGGRGIGKTYSMLKYLIENKIRFIYLRTYQRLIYQPHRKRTHLSASMLIWNVIIILTK